MLDPRAESDIDSAAQWYGQTSSELALKFLNAVDAAFVAIAEFPQAHREIDRGIRRMLIKKFPFCVYYRVDDDRVTVFALLHVRRRTDTWQQRLE